MRCPLDSNISKLLFPKATNLNKTLRKPRRKHKNLKYRSYSALRPHSSSFWGLLYRILNMNHKRELLWGLRVTAVLFTGP